VGHFLSLSYSGNIASWLFSWKNVPPSSTHLSKTNLHMSAFVYLKLCWMLCMSLDQFNPFLSTFQLLLYCLHTLRISQA